MKPVRVALLSVTLWALAACGDSTKPSDITGTYNATSFVLTRPGSPPVDVLAAGGSMILVLQDDGTTAGNLFVPRSLTGEPQDFEVLMEGTFTVAGNTVHFQQDADSFVRDVAWTVGANTLSASFEDSDASIEVTLTRS